MNKISLVVDMAADLFHRGHVKFLSLAREYFKDGPMVHLTVALHTDEQILSYKGRLPVQDFECRKSVLQSCRMVDEVMKAPDYFDKDFSDQFDFLAHGDDLLTWDQEKIDRFYSIFIKENKLILIPYTKGISTTKLIEIASLRDR